MRMPPSTASTMPMMAGHNPGAVWRVAMIAEGVKGRAK